MDDEMHDYGVDPWDDEETDWDGEGFNSPRRGRDGAAAMGRDGARALRLGHRRCHDRWEVRHGWRGRRSLLLL